ncbi:MAG: hypothetical protein AAF714_11060 [Pseudomonadota bacterium]
MSSIQFNLRLLKARFQAFRDDESGLASIESILLIPLLFWAYLGTFVIFDAFKKQTDGLRVTYAVADAISREDAALNQTYLNNMRTLTNFLTRSSERVTQRVTIVCFSESRDRYAAAWSRVSGPKQGDYPAHTDWTLDANDYRLPNLPLGDQLILVETFMDYQPVWNVGIDAKTFEYWVFTRPRFASQVKWENQNSWVCPAT